MKNRAHWNVIPSLVFALLTGGAAHAGTECADMASTPGILECLEYRTGLAEELVGENLRQLETLTAKNENNEKAKLAANQKAWLNLRNTSCGIALSKTSPGDEQGITDVACRLAETLKRVKELEDLVEAEKSGSNKSFREAIFGLTETRDPTVSSKKIESVFGVALINKEFAAAQAALMGAADVKSNRLRIKSLRLIDEGSAKICGDASVYIAELGFFARKTQKYVKIYVLTELNKDRSVKKIKTSVQDNIESDPVCPE